jgi:large subunit ribosomal protein L30e
LDVDKAITLAVKTGKVVLGTKRTLKLLKQGKPKMIIVSKNCPKETLDEINYYGKLSEISVYTYSGTSWDLGAVCGRPHMVSCIAVENPGDSKILKLKEE